ncbi:MAG: MurR/RpiR family transcriptional regulator [Gammaproteobacteria bacterium]
MAAHDAGSTLSHKILDLYDQFPRGERRLADLILRQSGDLSRHTASELSSESGVSKATVARFFQRLGYLNYRQARAQTRTDSVPQSAPATRLEHASNAQIISTDLNLHLSSDVQNLRHTFETIHPDDLRAVIDTLAAAAKIWVVGFDDDYALAHFARSLLIRIKPDIRMLPLGGFSVPEEFASITSQDAILGFGIRRRTPSLMRIARSGYEAGARIILVTDEAAGKPDLDILCLRCRTRGAFLFESLSAPFSLMTYICSSVASLIGEPAVERLHRIESIHDRWGDSERS